MTSLKAELSYSKIKALKNLKVAPGSTLIVAMASSDKGAVALKGAQAKELTPAFDTAASAPGFEGKSGQHSLLIQNTKAFEQLEGYAHLGAFGIGEAKDCFPQNVLTWGGKVAHLVKESKSATVDVLVDSFYQPASTASGKDAPRDFAGRPHPGGIPTREEFVELLALGLHLGLYRFDDYKSKARAEKKKPELTKIRLVSATLDEKKMNELLKRAAILAESVYLTRDLATTPANDLYPAEFAKRAQQVGHAVGFKTTVWDEKKLASENMNGILAVGVGSARPPRFIIMEHNMSKKNLPLVVLVGKGITFDTGGISIKPAAGMEDMKMDMSGAAAVMGAMHGLAKMNAPVRVVGLICSAENMPSDRATRPGDIYTARDGQTVEVINTDAEGRLVLSEALVYAKELNPTCVIDVATLTGAVIIALGAVSSGVMGNDGKLIDGFRKASEKIGEKVWELPLYADYQDDMRSKCADMRNSGNREAGSQKGGTFLNFFVNNAYPWIHLDIAGTDIPKGQGAHCPPDVGSGVATRALIEFAANVKKYF